MTTFRPCVWIAIGKSIMRFEAEKHLESRMLGNLHVRFGVGARVRFPGLHHVKVEPRSNNAISAGLSSFQGTTHPQPLDVARHPEKATATTKKLRARDRPLANDFLSDDDFNRLLDAWFANFARVLLPGRGFYIWGGYANLGNYPPHLQAHGLYFSQAIVWNKEHPVLTRKDFMGCFELAFYGWKKERLINFSARTMRWICGPSRK